MIITNKEKLREVCKDVSLFEAQDIISKLESELSKSEIGIGLAAPQIGIQKKVCIIRINNIKIDLVNPVIAKKYDLALFKNEGCLSLPGEYVNTKRFHEVVVRDLLHPAGMICTGLEAVVVQHEVGHLYGELMHDFIVEVPKGRNDLCWCKSGKKIKKCCLGKNIK
jgi:peptide deformylase